MANLHKMWFLLRDYAKQYKYVSYVLIVSKISLMEFWETEAVGTLLFFVRLLSMLINTVYASSFVLFSLRWKLSYLETIFRKIIRIFGDFQDVWFWRVFKNSFEILRDSFRISGGRFQKGKKH